MPKRTAGGKIIEFVRENDWQVCMRVKAALITGLIIAACLSVTARAQYGGVSAPVCVVELRDKSGQPVAWAGKGFAVRIAGRDYFLTTAHGMCEGMGGTPQSVLEQIGSPSLRSFTREDLGTAGRSLLVGSIDGRLDSDVMVFEISYSVRLQPLSIAPTLPAVGTRVWVLSKDGENFSNNSSVDKFAGTVSTSSMSGIFVKLDGPLTALHSSGSPVVDAKNQVVGMVCGTGAERKSVGCNPALAIYQRLYAAGQTQRTRSPSGVQTFR
ncbi:MAG: trypsin-like peptidase domain-containing protein [Candidatus Melainabacteria bacterium]|nr:trypsin-like peptidase domain-containing protein [Candidatus Melainabacteria bacterium]